MTSTLFDDLAEPPLLIGLVAVIVVLLIVSIIATNFIYGQYIYPFDAL